MAEFTGYFEELAAGGMGGYIVLGIMAFCALSVLWGAFRGLRRGAGRQLLHTVFTVCAAVAAFFLATYGSAMLFSTLGSMTTEELLARLEEHGAGLDSFGEGIRGTIESFDAETLMHVLALPVATVAVPIVFVLIFFVVNLVLKLIYLIVAAIAGLSRHGGIVKRLGGFVVGCAEGVLVAAVITLPVFGISATVTDATELVRGEEAATGFVEMSDACFAPISNSPVAGLVEMAGGEMIMQRFSTVNIDGTDTDLRGALREAIAIYAVGAPLTEANWTALNVQDKDKIDKIVDGLDASPYLESTVAGILRGTATAVDRGYIPVEAEAPYDKLMNELLLIFEGSTADNIATDVRTVVKVLYILSDEGVLAAVQEDSSVLTDALTRVDENGDTAVKRLIAAMKENERTAGLVSTLTELSLAMLSESLGLSDDAAELYTNVKDGIGDVLAIDRNEYATPEEYVDAVSDELDAKLRENDITLDKEIVDEMAKNIHENELDLGEITEETLDEVILSYYDAYLAGQLSGQ